MENTEEVKLKKEKIRTLYNKVQNKKAEIESAEKGTYVTDGVFKYGNNAHPIDIKTIRNKNQLVEILSFLLEKESFVNKANETLGYDQKFTWLGATVEEWTKDILVRKVQLSIVQEKSKLAEAEADLLRLDPSILEEIRLEGIEKILS